MIENLTGSSICLILPAVNDSVIVQVFRNPVDFPDQIISKEMFIFHQLAASVIKKKRCQKLPKSELFKSIES